MSKRSGAGWSSPVAHQAHNLKVAGSNPAPATIESERPDLPGSSVRIFLSAMLRFARERFSLRRNRGISRVRRTSRGFFGPEFFQDGADVLPEIVSCSRPLLPQGMLDLGERLPGRVERGWRAGGAASGRLRLGPPRAPLRYCGCDRGKIIGQVTAPVFARLRRVLAFVRRPRLFCLRLVK